MSESRQRRTRKHWKVGRLSKTFPKIMLDGLTQKTRPYRERSCAQDIGKNSSHIESRVASSDPARWSRQLVRAQRLTSPWPANFDRIRSHLRSRTTRYGSKLM